MENQRIIATRNIFESIRRIDQTGNEYWFARELMPLLEYDKWSNFKNVLSKAKKALESTNPHIEEHFTEVGKKIKIGKGTKKEATRSIKDYKLSRRACYLITQNGNPKKRAIALAQNYFAVQTRKQELLEAKDKNIERILARKKLSESEKKFTGVLSERGISGKGIAEIKSSGDAALFGSPTKNVKKRLGIDAETPLADHLPTISIKAKDLATEMSTYKTKANNLHGKGVIKKEHVNNSFAVRKMLTESGIYPERLPAEEDIKKLEEKYSSKEIKQVENSKLLAIDILEIDIIGVTSRATLERIGDVIKSNPGNSILRIYYGSKRDIKVTERNIQINSRVINGLKKYLVITDSLFT